MRVKVLIEPLGLHLAAVMLMTVMTVIPADSYAAFTI